MEREKTNHLVSIIHGFIIGFFQVIPFLRIDFIKNLTKVKSTNCNLNELLKNKWSYYIGYILGFIFFYALPISYLKENYLTTLGYIFLPIILLNLIANVFILIINKRSIINILINLLISTCFAIGFYFINLTSFSNLDTYSSYFIILIIMSVVSFISAYSNISIASLLLITSIYFPITEKLNKFALFQDIKGNFILVVFILLGLFLGYSINYILNRKVKIKSESKEAFSLPLLLLFLIYDLMNVINKSPIPTTNESKYATTILFIASLFASIVVSLIFIINTLNLEYKKTNYKRILIRKLKD